MRVNSKKVATQCLLKKKLSKNNEMKEFQSEGKKLQVMFRLFKTYQFSYCPLVWIHQKRSFGCEKTL